jgi:hypothetical protein
MQVPWRLVCEQAVVADFCRSFLPERTSRLAATLCAWGVTLSGASLVGWRRAVVRVAAMVLPRQGGPTDHTVGPACRAHLYPHLYDEFCIRHQRDDKMRDAAFLWRPVAIGPPPDPASVESRFGIYQRNKKHNLAPFGFTPMVPRFDNYWATILDTVTIEANLRKQPANTLPHFTLYRDELSNQRSTGVKPDGAESIVWFAL